MRKSWLATERSVFSQPVASTGRSEYRQERTNLLWSRGRGVSVRPHYILYAALYC
jgi:hypothetical protein